MNKLALTLAGLAFAVLPAAAQTDDVDFNIGSWDDFNKVEITSNDKRVETSIKFAFPMYFGTSVLTDLTYKGWWGTFEGLYPDFMDLDTRKNFVYALDMVSMHVRADAVDLSLGLRWTFMNFTFRDPSLTIRPSVAASSVLSMVVPERTCVPSRINAEIAGYDYTKSKLFASYLGIPFRVSFNYGKATIYGGVSAELLMDSYTKYKHPKYRESINGLFNDFRATVEAGFSLYNFGLFVNYGLTPLFKEQYSDARTLTIGVTLGI
jgi:hypothetical protein